MDEHDNPPTGAGEHEPRPNESDESWKEVGRQFENLGQGIGEAFRAALSSEQAREVKASLESMVLDVNMALKKAVESPEAQKVRAETVRTVDSVKQAGQQAADEVRPQAVKALRKLNEDLQQLIDRLERPAN